MAQLILFWTLMGMPRWYSHFGKQFGDFWKSETKFNIFSTNPIPRYLPKINENPDLDLHKHLYMNVENLFITTKTGKLLTCHSTCKWINYNTVSNWYMPVMYITLKYYYKRKEAGFKRLQWNDSIYVKFKKRQTEL